ERIGHPSSLISRYLLYPRPPFRHVLGCQTEIGSQQQQVVGRAKARMLQHAQRAAAAWMLQARLQGKHFPHTQRETLRNRDVPLRFARRPIAGVEDPAQLVSPLGWSR